MVTSTVQWPIQRRSNIHGTPRAAHVYTEYLHIHLKRHGYKQLRTERWLFVRIQRDILVIVAISIADFLTSSTNQALIEEFYQLFSTKYQTTWLGQPTMFLNWHIEHRANGIFTSNQDHITKAATMLSLENSSSNPTRYLHGISLDGPREDEESHQNIHRSF